MSSGPIYVTAVLYPKADKFDEVTAAAAEITKVVEATEPDVLGYYAFQTQTEVVFVETYKTPAAHEAHVKTDHFQSFFAKVGPLLEKPLEIKQGAFLSGFKQRPSS